MEDCVGSGGWWKIGSWVQFVIIRGKREGRVFRCNSYHSSSLSFSPPSPSPQFPSLNPFSLLPSLSLLTPPSPLSLSLVHLPPSLGGEEREGEKKKKKLSLSPSLISSGGQVGKGGGGGIRGERGKREERGRRGERKGRGKTYEEFATYVVAERTGD